MDNHIYKLKNNKIRITKSLFSKKITIDEDEYFIKLGDICELYGRDKYYIDNNKREKILLSIIEHYIK